jgi:hypothetical protein
VLQQYKNIQSSEAAQHARLASTYLHLLFIFDVAGSPQLLVVCCTSSNYSRSCRCKCELAGQGVAARPPPPPPPCSASAPRLPAISCFGPSFSFLFTFREAPPAPGTRVAGAARQLVAGDAEICLCRALPLLATYLLLASTTWRGRACTRTHTHTRVLLVLVYTWTWATGVAGQKTACSWRC